MKLRARQKFGKYVIERRIAEGGFAVVYQARDTIEGVRVALKIPYAHLVSVAALEAFRQEVRMAARLEHPHILPLKYADYIDGQFVMVTALGEMTLDERLQHRLSSALALDFSQQILAAVAYAHEQRIIHCDIKPANLLIFPGNQIRLTDFGIARVALATLSGSGAGTVGYVAPEQAMGKPSFRSDVFSIGLVLYRMFSGALPGWPYDWPPVNYARIKTRASNELIDLIRRAMELDARHRFADASKMLSALERIRSPLTVGRRIKRSKPKTTGSSRSWQAVRRKEFLSRFGKLLETHYTCSSCEGPVAETMRFCPWCGDTRRKHHDGTRLHLQCPRCYRGLMADWRYCPWCYGAGFDLTTDRVFEDRRYSARCDNPKCSRKVLMPFMRYCPWCHRRTERSWKIEGSRDCCAHCGWGVLKQYWSHCPWCGKK